MKFLVYTFLFFAALIGCAFSAMEERGQYQTGKITPSENIVTRSMTVDSFAQLEISSGIYVNFIQADSTDTIREVTIKGPDNLVDKVIVNNGEGKLSIGLPDELTIVTDEDSVARIAHMARIDSILRVDSLRNDSLLAIKARQLAEKDSLKTIKILKKMESDSLKTLEKAERDELKLKGASKDSKAKKNNNPAEKSKAAKAKAEEKSKAAKAKADEKAQKANDAKAAKTAKTAKSKTRAEINDSLIEMARHDTTRALSRKVPPRAKGDSSIIISEWADSVLRRDSIQQVDKFNRQDSVNSYIVVTIKAPAPQKIILRGSAKFNSISLKVEGLIVTLKDSSLFDVDTLIATWNRVELDSAALDSLMNDSTLNVKGGKVKKGKKSKKKAEVTDSISDDAKDAKATKSKKSKKAEVSDSTSISDAKPEKASKSKKSKKGKGEVPDSLGVESIDPLITDSISDDGGKPEKVSKSKKSKKSESNDSIDSINKEQEKAEKEAAKAEAKAKKDSLALVKAREDFVGHILFDAYDGSIIKVDTIYSEYVVLDMTRECDAKIAGETGTLNFNILHMSRATLVDLHALNGNVADAALAIVESQVDTVRTRSVSGVSLYDNIKDLKTQTPEMKSKTLEFKAQLVDAKYQIWLREYKIKESHEIAKIAKARGKVNKANARVADDLAREAKLAETLSASEYNKHRYIKSGGQTAKDQQQAIRSNTTPKTPQEARELAAQRAQEARAQAAQRAQAAKEARAQQQAARNAAKEQSRATKAEGQQAKQKPTKEPKQPKQADQQNAQQTKQQKQQQAIQRQQEAQQKRLEAQQKRQQKTSK